MAKTHDLAVKVGEYQTKDGQTKSRYLNVGVVLTGDKGPYILLDKTFNPAGVPGDGEKVLIAMFTPKEKKEGAEPTFNTNDEIPF